MKPSKPENLKNKIVRIYNAFSYAFKGLKTAYKYEAAFRDELLLCLVLFPVPFLVNCTLKDKVVLIGSLMLVLIVELLNSAIEAVVDLVSPDFNELAGKAKDMASAAVFMALCLVVIVWIGILV